MNDDITDAGAVLLCDLADALTDGRLAYAQPSGGTLRTDAGVVRVTAAQICEAVQFAGRLGILEVTR